MKFKDDIVRKIVIDFGEYSNQAIKILDETIANTISLETDRLVRCIIFLAEGDLNELNKYVETAILDQRDIILWAEYDRTVKGVFKRLRDFNKPFEECLIMRDTKLYAWILLTVREQPTSLWEILMAADGINRAEPSLGELQTSLGWLQAQELVKKEGKEYLLTETGVTLEKSISRGNIFRKWDAIAKRFSQLAEIDFQPDEITEKEVDAAYRMRRKEFKRIIQEEKSKEKKNASG
jgi:hypothetical protein